MLGGCAGTGQMASAVGTINRAYGEIQDETLLLNILRRSAGLPARFTVVSSVNGRSRISGGADLTLPFGRDAPDSFTLNPHLSVDQGPSYEVSSQSNQEFYRGYLRPVATDTMSLYFRQGLPKELLLSLFVERIELTHAGKQTTVINDPTRATHFGDFQALVRRLVDQGLTMEEAELSQRIGPALQLQPLSLEQLVSVRKEDLTVEAAGDGRYQVLKVARSARFCFLEPDDHAFDRVRCHSGGSRARFDVADPDFFGSIGGTEVSFGSSEGTSAVLHLRSLAEVLGYVGALARVQLDGGSAPSLSLAGNRVPIFVVRSAGLADRSLVATEFGGDLVSVPSGRQAGFSGIVLTILADLLAQAQSVKDLPFANTLRLTNP